MVVEEKEEERASRENGGGECGVFEGRGFVHEIRVHRSDVPRIDFGVRCYLVKFRNVSFVVF